MRSVTGAARAFRGTVPLPSTPAAAPPPSTVRLLIAPIFASFVCMFARASLRRRHLSVPCGFVIVRQQCGCRSGPAQDHVCRLLRNHDHGCIDVAADQVGHDRSIHNSEILHTAELEPRINDRIRVRPHAAGAAGVVGGGKARSNVAGELPIGPQVGSRAGLAPAKRGKRRLRRDLAQQLEPRAQGIEIVPLGEKVLRNAHGIVGISRAQPNLAAASRSQQDRTANEAVGPRWPDAREPRACSRRTRPEQKLDVRDRAARVRLHEGHEAARDVGGRARACNIGAREIASEPIKARRRYKGPWLKALMLQAGRAMGLPIAPDPDSINSCGVLIAPAQRMTSRAARTVWLDPRWWYSMPTARLCSITIRSASAFTSTRRFCRPNAGCR